MKTFVGGLGLMGICFGLVAGLAAEDKKGASNKVLVADLLSEDKKVASESKVTASAVEEELNASIVEAAVPEKKETTWENFIESFDYPWDCDCDDGDDEEEECLEIGLGDSEDSNSHACDFVHWPTKNANAYQTGWFLAPGDFECFGCGESCPSGCDVDGPDDGDFFAGSFCADDTTGECGQAWASLPVGVVVYPWFVTNALADNGGMPIMNNGLLPYICDGSPGCNVGTTDCCVNIEDQDYVSGGWNMDPKTCVARFCTNNTFECTNDSARGMSVCDDLPGHSESGTWHEGDTVQSVFLNDGCIDDTGDCSQFLSEYFCEDGPFALPEVWGLHPAGRKVLASPGPPSADDFACYNKTDDGFPCTDYKECEWGTSGPCEAIAPLIRTFLTGAYFYMGPMICFGEEEEQIESRVPLTPR